jgi:hypothetical protein
MKGKVLLAAIALGTLLTLVSNDADAHRRRRRKCGATTVVVRGPARVNVIAAPRNGGVGCRPHAHHAHGAPWAWAPLEPAFTIENK